MLDFEGNLILANMHSRFLLSIQTIQLLLLEQMHLTLNYAVMP